VVRAARLHHPLVDTHDVASVLRFHSDNFGIALLSYVVYAKIIEYFYRLIQFSLAKQVYLLTSMERATLPHAKSSIPHCTPSEITR